MSTIDVTSGETFSGTVKAGDTLIVEAGGQTLGAMVYGTELVLSGSLSGPDSVLSGGTITVEDQSTVRPRRSPAGPSISA